MTKYQWNVIVALCRLVMYLLKDKENLSFYRSKDENLICNAMNRDYEEILSD